jgi:hypothetical protein
MAEITEKVTTRGDMPKGGEPPQGSLLIADEAA